MRCDQCRWWKAIDDGDEVTCGTCHRNAPRPKYRPDTDEGYQQFNADWPWTNPSDWCGEFAAKDEKPTKRLPDNPLYWLRMHGLPEKAYAYRFAYRAIRDGHSLEMLQMTGRAKPGSKGEEAWIKIESIIKEERGHDA